ncbi:hypothetical protein HF521_004845 [Silurus meridionalis]|uniref:BOD1/SHG1 domain-containing protein n=1 Tax=Silurus meridionalis TaxID=175797 RepID=A0A8T0AXW7_SILME|nr:hypothetical protein HF521_004845 [Silurus meridionalis]
MAGLPPGDPQLVAMIVNHLKTQGLFDQFRRDCLADVDTKPAYLHLRQRVDNFVSNHLSNHTWSPQLNKNQLRNSIRQLVLQSGLLEQGVDRIVAQVVDPKVQHTFRPQVERVVRQFLSPGNHVEEEEPTHALTQILENQEAYLSSPVIPSAPVFDAAPSQSQDPSVIMAQDEGEEDMCLVEDETEPERTKEVEEQDEKLEGNKEETTSKELEEDEERPKEATEVGQQMEVPVEVKKEEQEEEKGEEKEKKGEEDKEKGEDTKDKKGSGKNKEESSADKLHILQKARERLKEEYSLEDSDLEGLSDITEGEITSEDEKVQKKGAADDSDENKEKKPRGSRQGYVHKPFLYSRYYSDSDDEVTVEQRRRSAAKDKEERLLKRQQNRERLEEKRRQKATQAELQEKEKQEIQRPQRKEAQKERKVLEKKVALSRKRKRDSRKEDDSAAKKKSDGDAESVKKDVSLLSFHQDAVKSKAISQKPVKKLSEEEQRRRKSLSEDSSEPRKILDKNRTHSFILDLELGTEEALRQRGVGKNERHARREKERKENEKERSQFRQKPESKKGGDNLAEEKEGGVVKVTVDDKVEKKGSKVKGDKKGSASAREGRLSVTEGSALEEGNTKDVKKEKIPSEIMKEKTKGEKSLGKSDSKPQHRLDSTGSIEDSHPEGKSLEKLKARQDGKDVGAGSKDKSSTLEAHKYSSDTRTKTSEASPKVKSVPEKARSKSRDDLKSQSPSVTKTDKKAQSQEAKGKAGVAPIKPEYTKEKKKEGVIKEDRRVSEDRIEKGKDAKSAKKTSEKKTNDFEKKGGDSENEQRTPEVDDLSSSSSAPSAIADEVETGGGMDFQTSNDQTRPAPKSLTTSVLTTQQVSDSLFKSEVRTAQFLESLPVSHVSNLQTLDSAPESDSTDQSISKSLRKPDLTLDSQAMDTESDHAALQSTDVESNLTDPQAMDTESEPTAPQANAVQSDLASPHSESLQSQPTQYDLAIPPPQQISSDSQQRPELMNFSESNLTVPEPDTPHTRLQSSDSSPVSILPAPESSDSIPESDLMVAQPSNVKNELAVPQGSDTLPADVYSTSVSDDMYDALSDITPDPEDEEEATIRLSETQDQHRNIPAEADALLSLMDVCASAAVSSSTGTSEAETSIQDADIKMKEAA